MRRAGAGGVGGWGQSGRGLWAPVAAVLGKPWKTPYLYYYKGIKEPLPRVVFDVSGYKEKVAEALATQIGRAHV